MTTEKTIALTRWTFVGKVMPDNETAVTAPITVTALTPSGFLD